MMKREVLTFIFDGYADWESAYVCAELNAGETDYIVKTISLDNEAKISMAGFKTIPDYTIYNFPKDFSMLLLIGGNAWMENKNNDVKALVDYAIRRRIPVAAICGATFFLGEEGYLNDIKHTSNTLEYLKIQAPNYKGDSNYIEKQAACDGGIITANGTGTLEFAREILLYLKAKPEDKIEEWYKFHKKGFCTEI